MSGKVPVIIFFVVALIISVIVVCSFITTDYVVTITGKESIVSVKSDADGNVSSTETYYVYGLLQDGSSIVFVNQVEWIRGKFTTRSLQAQFIENCTYHVKACGLRIPVIDVYENILSAELIEGTDTVNTNNSVSEISETMVIDITE